MAGSRKTGDWKRGQRLIEQAARAAPEALRRALLQEAHQLRGQMVQGIADQAPGGKRFRPLSAWTLAIRRLKGGSHTKALIDTGSLRASITVHNPSPNRVFVGLLRTQRHKSGRGIVNIGVVHEFGAGPFVVRVTPKMRRFLAVVARKAGMPAGGGGGRGYVVIRIPARPFVRPTWERFGRLADIRQRLQTSFSKLLRRELGL